MRRLWGLGGGGRAELHGIRQGVVGECASRKARRLVFAAALAARTAGRPLYRGPYGAESSCTLLGDRRILQLCLRLFCEDVQRAVVAHVLTCPPVRARLRRVVLNCSFGVRRES
jgi:hypothetical protein